MGFIIIKIVNIYFYCRANKYNKNIWYRIWMKEKDHIIGNEWESSKMSGTVGVGAGEKPLGQFPGPAVCLCLQHSGSGLFWVVTQSALIYPTAYSFHDLAHQAAVSMRYVLYPSLTYPPLNILHRGHCLAHYILSIILWMDKWVVKWMTDIKRQHCWILDVVMHTVVSTLMTKCHTLNSYFR